MSATPWVLGIAGALALLLTALGMPPAVRGWNALGRKDREISLRKVHSGEIPRVGGFVLMLGFAIVAIRGLAGTTELSATHEWFSQNPLTGAVLGALICGAVGLYDDLVGLRARYKLLGQVFAAALAVFGFGLHWEALAALLGPAEVLADPLTVLFLVAAGLQLVFGVQKIVNLACGSFYALGAYFGITFIGPSAGFASVSIGLDKPFEPGDYIAFETDQGTVTHIGIKSTRIVSPVAKVSGTKSIAHRSFAATGCGPGATGAAAAAMARLLVQLHQQRLL